MFNAKTVSFYSCLAAIVLAVGYAKETSGGPTEYTRAGLSNAAQCSGTDTFVNPSALKPKVLRDSAAMRDYIDSFPREAYEVIEWEGVGRFYIDTLDDAIKRRISSGEGWEAHIADLLRKHIRPKTAVLDIGAHIGTHTLAMTQSVGSEGQVYAFEPQKKIFRELVENLRLNDINNATPLRFALGDGPPRVIEMNVATKGNEGGTRIGSGGDEAELRSIDSFGFCNVSAIKIDVEGFENHVLRGAQKTIARERPVLVVEILGGVNSNNATPEQLEKIDETKAIISNMGYRIQKVGIHDYLGIPFN